MSKKVKEIIYPDLTRESQLIDTHCHLDMEHYSSDLDEVLGRAVSKGVKLIITVGIDLESSRKALILAEKYSEVFATVGVHPHNVNGIAENVYEEMATLARHPKVVGYGEIGIDLYYDHAPEDVQKHCFSTQIDLAKELALPIVIHDRDAHPQVLRILQEKYPFPAGGVMHCFSGDSRFAEEIMELGLVISIPGVVTFKKSAILQQVVRDIPLDRMILETDGPFLAPEPRRGRRNEPALLLFTAARVAELKGVDINEVAMETTKTAKRLFALPQ